MQNTAAAAPRSRKRSRGSTPSTEEARVARTELLAKLARLGDTPVEDVDPRQFSLSYLEKRLLAFDPDDPEQVPPPLEPIKNSNRFDYERPLDRPRVRSLAEHQPWTWPGGKHATPPSDVCGTDLVKLTGGDLRRLGPKAIRVYRYLHQQRGSQIGYMTVGVQRLAEKLKLAFRTAKRCLARLRACGAIVSTWQRIRHLDGYGRRYWETWFYGRLWGTVDLRDGVLRLFLPRAQVAAWREGLPVEGWASDRPTITPKSKSMADPSMVGSLHDEPWWKFRRRHKGVPPCTRDEFYAIRREGRDRKLARLSGPPNLIVRRVSTVSTVKRFMDLRKSLEIGADTAVNEVHEESQKVDSLGWPITDPRSDLLDHTNDPSDHSALVAIAPAPSIGQAPRKTSKKRKSCEAPKPVLHLKRPPSTLLDVGPASTVSTPPKAKPVPDWFIRQLPLLEPVVFENVAGPGMVPLPPRVPEIILMGRIADAYQEGVLLVWGEEQWNVAKKNHEFLLRKYKQRFKDAIAFFKKHDIPPLSWVLWIVKHLKDQGGKKPPSIVYLFSNGLFKALYGFYVGTKDDPFPIKANFVPANFEQLHRRSEALRRIRGLSDGLIWSSMPRWYTDMRRLEIANGFLDPLQRWPIIKCKPGQPSRIDRRPKEPK